jgi:metallo-beta-lactamase family protein
LPLSIRFLGAARTVTGSKYFLEIGAHRLLIDCGLFQGLKPLRLRNWDEFPVAASEVDTVVLTHAHLDHCGYLPRLVAHGFNGPVFCTPATRDLCTLVLPDAGRLQEEDAERANRHGYTKHTPALPLFRESDAYRALSLFKPVAYGAVLEIAPGVQIEFINAGHLLGSAYVRLTIAIREGSRTILFGGDLGRYARPVLPDPVTVTEADVLLLESTYGDRQHAPDDGGEALAAIIKDTAERGGKVIVPAFAIGRVEEVVYWIDRLEEEDRIPTLPVYVDSPMAADAL